jgi:hypothetical protein
METTFSLPFFVKATDDEDLGAERALVKFKK